VSKILNDKYYTSKELAKYCINKTYEIIGEENISEVIEPAAGNGSFSLQVPTICWAYDIEPEHESIMKQDFLKLDIGYLWGRLIIGNPPYGNRNTLAVQFLKDIPVRQTILKLPVRL
jgi:predicted RNA methylase